MENRNKNETKTKRKMKINRINNINNLHLKRNHCLRSCCYPINNIQNAIANMIFAQGEEIKKIVSLAEDTSCITDINCLINKNIYQLTIFENSLNDYFKYCCPIKNSPIKPDCNCNIDGGIF